jgi:hypothetical protein
MPVWGVSKAVCYRLGLGLRIEYSRYDMLYVRMRFHAHPLVLSCISRMHVRAYIHAYNVLAPIAASSNIADRIHDFYLYC